MLLGTPLKIASIYERRNMKGQVSLAFRRTGVGEGRAGCRSQDLVGSRRTLTTV